MLPLCSRGMSKYEQNILECNPIYPQIQPPLRNCFSKSLDLLKGLTQAERIKIMTNVGCCVLLQTILIPQIMCRWTANIEQELNFWARHLA